MKPVSPHHLLSAYLDGELTPSERAEVERLLEESPAARRELDELEQVGELLRQIPREALPGAFASHVLDVCLSDTDQFESETLTGTPAKPLEARVFPPRKPNWLRAAGLTITIAALGLIVIVNFPERPQTNDSEIAQNTPTHGDSDEAPQAESDHLMAPGESGFAEVHNQAGSLQDSAPADLPGDSRDKAQALVSRALAAPIRGADDSSSELTPVSPLGVIEALDQNADQVAVVTLSVADRGQGLRQLRSLLERHQIHAARSPNRKSSQSDAKHIAVYVETSDKQFAAALRDLRKEAAFQKLTLEAPLAMAQLSPMLAPPKNRFGSARRSRAMSFGAGGSARPQASRFGSPGIKAMRAPQARPAAATPSKKAPQKTAAKKTRETKRESPAKPSPNAVGEDAPKSKKSPAPTISAAGAAPLNKLRDRSGKADRGKVGAKPMEKSAAALNQDSFQTRSRQQEFTLPKPVLDELQKRPAKDHPGARQTRGPENAPPPASRGRVKVVFVFVDQTEPATPAKQPAPKNR